ncbi:MAG: hypothetical protein ACO3JZ_02885 [Schleiferiaceae bacterium]|nr:MAG: hypothetical protein C7N14_01710 [Bacteroidota bacterium]
MRRNSLLAVLILCFSAAAQPTEETLKRLGNEYLKPSNSAISDSLANLFADSLWAFISIESNFGVPLNKVNNLSVQLPDDKSFALYSWAVPKKQTGEYSFHGYLWKPDWNGPKRIVLEDYNAEGEVYRWLKGGQWVGGICYDIITKKSKGQKSYTLLTFRPGRTYHTKYIDAIEPGKSRKQLHFGSKIFNIQSNGDEHYLRRPYRIQFRYNSSVSVAVRWDGKHSGIICDHLAPSKENLKEKWFAYGPDFSYDRIYWERGKWYIEEGYPLVQNIDIAPTNGRIPTTLDPKK